MHGDRLAIFISIVFTDDVYCGCATHTAGSVGSDFLPVVQVRVVLSSFFTLAFNCSCRESLHSVSLSSGVMFYGPFDQ